MNSGRSTCCYFVGFSYDFGIYVFWQVRFQWIPFKIFMEHSCALVEPKAQKQWKSLAKLIILVFSICSIVKDLEKHEKIMKFRRPYGATHKGISVIFIDFY